MKLEIQANDFCPDNCRHCEPALIQHNDLTYEWLCKNRERCKILAEGIAKSEMCRFTNNQAKDDQE